MAVEALLVVVLAVATGVVLLRRYPDATLRWFNRIRAARALIFGVFSLAVAFAFISSGSLLLMFVGGLMLLYGVVWVLVDDVTDTILEAIPL